MSMPMYFFLHFLKIDYNWHEDKWRKEFVCSFSKGFIEIFFTTIYYCGPVFPNLIWPRDPSALENILLNS
jgi:hypothetical protein